MIRFASGAIVSRPYDAHHVVASSGMFVPPRIKLDHEIQQGLGAVTASLPKALNGPWRERAGGSRVRNSNTAPKPK